MTQCTSLRYCTVLILHRNVIQERRKTKPNLISIISLNICKLATNKLYNLIENLTTYEGIQLKGSFLKGKQPVAQKCLVNTNF